MGKNMIGGINPWIRMWGSPRLTIRAIVNVNPRYGVFWLAWVYVIQVCFFVANTYSLGLSYSFLSLLGVSLILSPFIGWLWLYFTGWVLYFTGRWFGGDAPMSHLRAAAAWSKLPVSIALLMWFILMFANPEWVFIQGMLPPSTIFIQLITLILGIWSFVLLIQSVREVQGFPILKTILNLIVVWVVSSIASVLIFSALKYLYTTIYYI
ncbi:MAG: hypothetical protein FJZ64_04480 [Chlamydiae bacterium]|nr:hypothetical protein [Chlamydiota bacterium]